MLGARKLHLLAGLKVGGVTLRSQELDFYLQRYIQISGLSAVVCFLTFNGMIKVVIPVRVCRPTPVHENGALHHPAPHAQEGQQPDSEQFPGGSWEVMTYYISAALTMVLSLFNLFLTSFLVVNAQSLALRGPPGAVADCVKACRDNW